MKIILHYIFSIYYILASYLQDIKFIKNKKKKNLHLIDADESETLFYAKNGHITLTSQALGVTNKFKLSEPEVAGIQTLIAFPELYPRIELIHNFVENDFNVNLKGEFKDNLGVAILSSIPGFTFPITNTYVYYNSVIGENLSQIWAKIKNERGLLNFKSDEALIALCISVTTRRGTAGVFSEAKYISSLYIPHIILKPITLTPHGRIAINLLAKYYPEGLIQKYFKFLNYFHEKYIMKMEDTKEYL